VEIFATLFAVFIRQLFLVILLLSVFAVSPAFPASRFDRMLIEVPTRPDVKVPVYLMKRIDAVATLMLLPGGYGGFTVKKDGPESDDFLVKNCREFALKGFNVAVVGKPGDKRELDLQSRRGFNHLTDLRGVVEYLRSETSLPVWLIGTSKGTVSAASAAIVFGNEDLAEILLTSSITSAPEQYSVP
jgi:hypothetical protein